MSTEIVTYCTCMEELKQRIDLVRGVLTRAVTTAHEAFDTELVFLQLRKTLEHLAFASLAANKAKYSAAYASFATHWNARRMLRDLETVNPDFYPVPVTVTRVSEDGQGRSHWHAEPLTDGFMSKDEFVFLYEKCGRILHARNPFDTQDPVIQIGHTVEQWVQRIQGLLSLHMVRLVDGDKWIVQIPSEGAVHGHVCTPVDG